eukprot:SAG31_NODE_2560_length_5482_cov_7.141373_3_plen_149_part_00
MQWLGLLTCAKCTESGRICPPSAHTQCSGEQQVQRSRATDHANWISPSTATAAPSPLQSESGPAATAAAEDEDTVQAAGLVSQFQELVQASTKADGDLEPAWLAQRFDLRRRAIEMRRRSAQRPSQPLLDAAKMELAERAVVRAHAHS